MEALVEWRQGSRGIPRDRWDKEIRVLKTAPDGKTLESTNRPHSETFELADTHTDSINNS